MNDWPVLLLIMEGIPFLGFVYYLEHKKKMHLLERTHIKESDPMQVRRERRLISGLFLSLSGASLIASPNIASFVGLKAGLTFELFVMGMVVLCSGLAMLLGYGILRTRSPYSDAEGLTEFE